jgi:hypothetical protein
MHDFGGLERLQSYFLCDILFCYGGIVAMHFGTNVGDGMG